MDPEEIYVLDQKVRLLQLAEGGFRTSLDSVMLAAACLANDGDHVLDAGCGVGGAGLCVLWRRPHARLTGVEWELPYIELARQNAQLNNCAARAEFFHSDIREFRAAEKNQAPVFDHVIINPPYMEAGRHTPSPDSIRAQALGHQEENLDLEDWIKAAHRLVRSGGSLTMIYPAHGTARIIQGLGRKFGAIEIIPLWPRIGADAKRVIIRAIKDRKTPARMLYGLVLHQDNGDYTADAERILRSGAPLC